jgi:hypothetical protein
VDGRWITDPQNSNYAVLKGHKDAKSVRLSGTFNNWDTDGYTLSHKGDEWTISLYLKPGKYLYKFIVDGQWILDSGNKLWEPNESNGENSVLWME